MNGWTISLDIKRMVITIKTYLVQRVLSWKHYYAQILFKNIYLKMFLSVITEVKDLRFGP